MKYLGDPSYEKEFWLRLKCYEQVKVEYARKWREEHGYKEVPPEKLPIRAIVERDKFLDRIMDTEEAKKKVAELVVHRKEAQ